MDDQNFHNPLIINGSLGSETAIAQNYKKPFWVSSAKWIIKCVMWVIFIAWVAFIFLLPAKFMNNLYSKYTRATNGTLFGTTGSIFLLLSAPVLILAILSIAYLTISGEEDHQLHLKKGFRRPRFRLWTFPVIVEGPFGVVSATEFIGIVLFSVYIIWAVYMYSMQLPQFIPHFLPSKLKSMLTLEVLGFRFGSIGLYCTVFLFLPVARGSVLLRIIDIPFEHATKYHVWLGHLTMLLFTLHGLFYVIAWAMDGRLWQQLLEWREIGVANLAGVISLLAGLLMWVTSLGPVRKKFFELFFYTHQLYVVFVLFMAMHVGDFIFSISAGGIFLFILDRFLRFCQSRRTVDIISTKCLPCGTLELVLSKPANLRYNALSFIFLRIRELSWLQWHPFSVSSSPLDGKFQIAVLIKVLGEWTEKLKEKVSSDAELPKDLSALSSNKITASVEGPYGHEVPYHLMYEHLILVAGGIGVSPFLAVLSDILHRINEGKPCLPRNISLIWAVKKSDELPILSTIDMESICPSFPDKVDLKIDIYVTRESEPPLEEGYNHNALKCCTYPKSNGRGMSVLVGTGNNIWSGLYVISSIFGFVILMALLDVFYIEPFGVNQWWYRGLLFVACMLASVFLFGGIVIGLWHVWERRMSVMEQYDEAKVFNKVEQLNGTNHKVPSQENIANSTAISYGTRPDFKEIFESTSARWGNVDVGVLVCGPPALQSSVAREIRSINIRRKGNQAIFHFNSHSFDL